MRMIILALFGLVFNPGAFAGNSEKPQVLSISITEKGFEPTSFDVPPGTIVTLKVTRKTDATCATQIKIPAKKVKKDLPLNQAVSIDLGKLEKGEIRFACGMDMLSGRILVK